MIGPNRQQTRLAVALAGLAAAAMTAAAVAGPALAAATPQLNRLVLEAAGWDFIAMSDDTLVYMKDAGRAGPAYRQHTAYDSMKPRDHDGFAFRSVQSVDEFNCQEGRSRVVGQTFFANPNLKGKAFAPKDFKPTDWAQPKPGSVGDLRLDYACRDRAQA